MKMNKLIVAVVLSTTLVAGACATVGCNSTGDNSSDNDSQITISNGIQSSGDFFAYGAASIGSIISANASDAAVEAGYVNSAPVVVGEIIGETTDGDETSNGSEGETPGEDETPNDGENSNEDETPNEGDAPNEGDTPNDGDGNMRPDDKDHGFDFGSWGNHGNHNFDFGGWGNHGNHGFDFGGWGNHNDHDFDLGGWGNHGNNDFNHGNGGENNEDKPQLPDESQGLPSAELTEEQIETVNGYMTLVENLLSNGNLGCVKYESDREGYAVKEVITYGDLQGNVVSYTVYYNITLDYIEEDGEEVEENYTLSGVMVIDGVDYVLEGHSETETEGEEVETQSYFKVVLSDGNYIIMENEQDGEEKSLVYKFVENKKVVEKISFEYENEQDEVELEMTVEKDGSKTTLEFTKQSLNDATEIEVVITTDCDRAKFNILVTKDDEGNDVYRYTFGEKIKDMHKRYQKEANSRR